MRKQTDGVAAIVKEVLKLDPISGTLIVFIDRRKTKLKILLWEKNGLVIWYERLERHKFHWPRRFDTDPAARRLHRHIRVRSDREGAQGLAR
jgi:transposase